MKGSVELDGLPSTRSATTSPPAPGLLGRAHAQSPTAGQVLGYVGGADAASGAIVKWSVAYADQSLRDFEEAAAATW